MLSTIYSQVGQFAFLFSLNEILSPEFWTGIYANGRVGHGSEPNLLLVILSRIVVAAGILLAARIAVALSRKIIAHGVAAAITRSGQGQRRLTTLQGLLTSSLSYIIYFVAILLILFTFGLTWKALAPFVGAASIIAFAIGLGAQRIVRDVITGLFILGEGQFDVGDTVMIGGVVGYVEDIGLRVTRLRDDQGRLYFIANGDISQVFNSSRGPVKLAMDLDLDSSTPIDEGITLIRQIADETLAQFGVTPADNQRPMIIVVGMSAEKTAVRLLLWIPAKDKAAIEDTIRRQLLHVVASKDSKFMLAAATTK